MKPLDQVRSTGAYAPDHTAKVHNKFDTRRSILEELRNCLKLELKKCYRA